MQNWLGKARVGAPMDEYLDRAEFFLDTHFSPPDGHVMNDSPGHWTRETFEDAVGSEGLERRHIIHAFDETGAGGRIDFGAGAVGQAHLVFTCNGPQILQITTGWRVRGSCSLGSVPKDKYCWKPLQQPLAPLGGYAVNGSAPSKSIRDFFDDQWRQDLIIAKQVGECLGAREAG